MKALGTLLQLRSTPKADPLRIIHSFTYPSVVLARSKRQWWGARLLRYETPAKDAQGKGGKPATGKFVVEWVDGTVSNVNKEDILTSSQSAFFTVKMGTTHLELPRDYVETLVEFAQDLHPIYQRIIDEDYPPATDWSNLFYQGGKSRDALAKKARFGELRDEHTEALQKEITTWASGGDVKSFSFLSLCSPPDAHRHTGSSSNWIHSLRGALQRRAFALPSRRSPPSHRLPRDNPRA